MKRSISKLFLLVPAVLSMTGCALDLNDIYSSDAYNSTDYMKNFYREYSARIKPKNYGLNPLSDDNKNDNVRNVYNITLGSNEFTTKYSQIGKYDTEATTKAWTDSLGNPKTGMKYEYYEQGFSDVNAPYYGEERKLGKSYDFFKKGALSKLYDGRLFCGGKQQLNRVQLEEGGFGQLFNKEFKNLTAVGDNQPYFAFNYKSWIQDSMYNEDPSISYDALNYETELDYYVNFYFRDGEKYDVVRVKLHMTDCPVRCKGNEETEYRLVAFSFTDVIAKLVANESYLKNGIKDLNRCCGYSMDYELPKDSQGQYQYITDEIANNKMTVEQSKRVKYSIMLYEVLMPFSIWN